MYTARSALISLLFSLLLTACASLPPPPQPTLYGIDGIACVGRVEQVPVGLEAANDEGLLQSVLGRSGEGKLCAGQVYVARQGVTVYRVWNSAKAYTLYGSWWSFQLPRGPKQDYRRANGICPEWSELDRMSACRLKPGTHLVVGPGQSAQCQQGLYAKSAVNQVFIPNDGRNNILHVEQCDVGVVWP